MKKQRFYSLTHLASLMSVATYVLIFVGCSTFQSKDLKTFQLKVAQDVTVRKPDGTEQNIKKDGSVELGSEALLVEKPGHVSLLAVPANSERGEATVSLKPIKEFGGPELDKYVDAYVTELMTKVNLVQESIARSQFDNAFQKTKALQVEYPNLMYLKFLEASCLTLMGQKAEAQRVLNRALEVHPNNPEGQRLNRYLSGSR